MFAFALNISTISDWDLMLQNTFVSVLMTYIIDKALQFMRGYFGQRNISRKTLVDEMFLI